VVGGDVDVVSGDVDVDGAVVVTGVGRVGWHASTIDPFDGARDAPTVPCG
jgi:hypothetical protein